MGSGVRVTSKVAVARGVNVTNGASVAVGMTSVAGGDWQAAKITPIIKAIIHDGSKRTVRFDIGITRLMLILTVLWFGGSAAAAQPDSTAFLTFDTPLPLRLEGDGRPAVAYFEGVAGQVVTVAAHAPNPTEMLDLVLEVMTPSGERLAYNDDWAGERTDISAPEGWEMLTPTDSAIVRVILPESGDYAVRVNTFNGEGVGQALVMLSAEFVRGLSIGATRTVGLHRAEIVSFALDLTAGQQVIITAAHPRGRLDPVLEVKSPTGEFIAVNDDYLAGSLDAQVMLTAPVDGMYGVQLRDFLGRTGLFYLTVVDAP